MVLRGGVEQLFVGSGQRVEVIRAGYYCHGFTRLSMCNNGSYADKGQRLIINFGLKCCPVRRNAIHERRCVASIIFVVFLFIWRLFLFLFSARMSNFRHDDTLSWIGSMSDSF